MAAGDSLEVKIESNIKAIEAEWRRMIERFRPNLLRNMIDVCMLVKRTVIETKMRGQVIKQGRTGKTIASMLPTSPATAARREGNTVVGAVGAQAGVAPWVRRLERGGPSYPIAPAMGRPFAYDRGSVRPAGDPRARLGWGGSPGARVFFARQVTIPAARPRFFIKNTILERERQIRDALMAGLIEFPK
jgi:hypothetical protein